MHTLDARLFPLAAAPRIDRVRVDWGSIPVKLVFSYGQVGTFPFLIVRLGSGPHVGMGEVVVPPTEFLTQLCRRLPGADARRLDTLLPEEVFAPDAPGGDHARILCEAVSMALYDLLGHVAGLPLHALLGGARQTAVPLMPCIFPNNADEARAGARRWSAQGCRFLKMKLVGDPAEDRARVEAVRSVWPRERTLQGDANCGYKTLATAQRALAELGAAGLDIFEDPLEGGVAEYAELTRRRGPADAKVMIDALSRRTADLTAALRAGACDVVGLHPDQPGSLSRVLRHAALAAAFGVPLVVGGTGYTGVGTAAYQHVAGVLGGPAGELGGFFDHGMPRSLVKQPLPMRDGCVHLPDSPGLGVALDEAALDEFREGTQEFP